MSISRVLVLNQSPINTIPLITRLSWDPKFVLSRDSLYFGPNDDNKRTFWNQLTFSRFAIQPLEAMGKNGRTFLAWHIENKETDRQKYPVIYFIDRRKNLRCSSCQHVEKRFHHFTSHIIYTKANYPTASIIMGSWGPKKVSLFYITRRFVSITIRNDMYNVHVFQQPNLLRYSIPINASGLQCIMTKFMVWC